MLGNLLLTLREPEMTRQEFSFLVTGNIVLGAFLVGAEYLW